MPDLLLLPQQTDDQSKTCYSSRYAQTYHSIHGARTEARYVFLESSGAARRLRDGLPTRVLEIGFGLGLNFLLTADTAEVSGAQLHYRGVEHDLISAATLRSLRYQDFLHHPDLVEKLAAHLNAPAVGTPCRLSVNNELVIHQKDALDVVFDKPQFHAIYLDAFSPDVNPECWSEEFLGRLGEWLLPAGMLSTYCVKGGVQRAFKAAGFTIEKRPGPPGKREILVARRKFGV